MFSKRHYEFVARVLRDSRTPFPSTCPESFADAFAVDNPRFDRARFLKACGVGEPICSNTLTAEEEMRAAREASPGYCVNLAGKGRK